MGAKGSLREHIAGLLYDELEPFKILDGVLLSVFADENCEWLCRNFSPGGLLFRAQSNDDTIVVRDGMRQVEGLDVSGGLIWKELIGQEFGWGWLSINHRGYIDAALIGSRPIPNVAFTVVASGLKVSRLGDWQSVSKL